MSTGLGLLDDMTHVWLVFLQGFEYDGVTTPVKLLSRHANSVLLQIKRFHRRSNAFMIVGRSAMSSF